jgi:hypothetical protein
MKDRLTDMILLFLLFIAFVVVVYLELMIRGRNGG